MTEVIFTLKVNKYVWDIILALEKLAKIPSAVSMVESRLWSCRSPDWKKHFTRSQTTLEKSSFHFKKL